MRFPTLPLASLLLLAPAAAAHDPVVVKEGGAPTAPATSPADDVDLRPEIYSDEPEADLGPMLQGEVRPHSFVVGNRGTAPLVLRSVTATCGCTVAQVRAADGRMLDPRTHSPGSDLLTLAPGETCEILAEFNSRGQALGHLTKHVNVISNDDRQPMLSLTMTMEVQQGVVVEPTMLHFGDVGRGEEKTMTAYVKLQALKDLDIVEFVGKPEYVDATWSRGQAPDGSDAIVVDVKLLADAPLGYLSPVLVAKTNDPRLQQLNIQLQATVKSEVAFDTGNATNKERIDFEVVPFGTSRTKAVDIYNNSPATPYHVTGCEIESKHAEHFTTEVETLEEGRHYRVTLTSGPDLDARFFRGVLKIRSDHPDVPEKDIHFHGWVKKG